MYVYDALDATLVAERAAEFRGQVARRLAGDLTEEEFKPLRLMNGVYLQLHAYMLRVAIPYGVLSPAQLRALAHVARRWDKGYAHFTTRQNVQFNWPALVDVPDILDHLAGAGMHAIQTSGNCIRNVTTDPYAGAAADEIEDPRPWCELIRQWSTLHPEFSFLPRKFKIAVSGAREDRAATRVHDVGLQIVERSGARGFAVSVGGGLGRTPHVGVVIRDFLPAERLLSYLEAILRTYNLEGRRDNKYKARIKILVHEGGADAFRDAVEAEWRAMGDDADAPPAEIARIRAQFAPPRFAPPADDHATASLAAQDPAFARWLRVNVRRHKAPGHASVEISLKPPGAPPGDISAAQLEAVADIAERYGFGEARSTDDQNLALPHVRRADLPAVWRALLKAGLATANAGLASDIVACPGLDYCSLANARSIPVAERLSQALAAAGDEETLGALSIKVSGCINACARHHVADIGVLGVDKKGEEFYQVLVGGSSAYDARLAEGAGRALSADETVAAVLRIVDTFRRLRHEGETFAAAASRLGLAPFKDAVHA